MAHLVPEIRYTTGTCAFGVLLLAINGDGEICAILLGDDAAGLVDDLRTRHPLAELNHAPTLLGSDLASLVDYIANPSTTTYAPNRPLAFTGTAFQLDVWKALSQVGPGETISYAELAHRIGKPKAVRAVARACAANPLAIVVPCHRVLRSDGGISGYRWGVERKRQLLALESQLASCA